MSTDRLTPKPLAMPFDIVLSMPGSKSHANRAIIAACLTDDETRIENATPCDDVALLVKNLQAMGFAVAWKDGDAGMLSIRGGIPPEGRSATLSCGNAGTTLRFLTALACVVPGEWIITGNEHMLRRPIGPLVDALTELGADIEAENGCPPVRVRGGTISGSETHLDATRSSQYLTALLLIGPKLPNGLTVHLTEAPTSPTYITLTEKVLKDFEVSMTKNDTTITVPATNYKLQTTSYAIEGDWSAAGTFLVLAEITGSRIQCPNLDQHSEQGDRRLPELIRTLRGEGDRVIDCTDTPDQLMNLAVLAGHRNGTTTFTGAANLRQKECDRLTVITTELTKVGITIKETADGVTIQGTPTLKSAILDPHDDHRMAMAFAILASLHEGITILNPDCVAKSYPHFFEDLQSLHRFPRCIAIVGMRGCGKTNLADRLASKLKLRKLDTDKAFERAAGPIKDFVTKHGWAMFREGEEHAVNDCLMPGCVVALGGGAIESPTTRENLDRKSLVIWMQETEQTIIQRLREADRPPLTDLPLEEEVPMIMKKREPFYAELADIVLPAGTPFGKQIPILTAALQKRCSW